MKTTLILAAAFALTTSAAFAQTTPTTGTSGTSVPVSTPQGTMNSGALNSSDPTKSGRIDNRMSTSDNDGSMRSNKRAMRKGSKMKTNSDGTMKTKM